MSNSTTQFARAFAAAIKYAVESPWQNLLGQLQGPKQHLRWDRSPEAAEFRAVAADAYSDHHGSDYSMTDEERDRRAALIRDHNQHIMFVDGKPVRGRHTLRHITEAFNDISDHFTDHQQHNPTDHISIDTTGQHFLSHEWVDPYEHDPDFMEGPGDLPHGHVRVVDVGGEYPHHIADTPWHELGNTLADSINDEAERYTDWDEMGDEGTEAFDRLLHYLRTAPHEEPAE